MLGLILIFGLPTLIHAEDACAHWNGNCTQCTNFSDCSYILAESHENKGFCINRNQNKGLTESQHAVQDCSQFDTNTTKPSTTDETTKPTSNTSERTTVSTTEPTVSDTTVNVIKTKPTPSETKTIASKANPTEEPVKTTMAENDAQVQNKSSSGWIFFGGIVFAVVLLALVNYGRNKYQTKRDGTPVRYGLLSGTPSGQPSREGYDAK